MKTDDLIEALRFDAAHRRASPDLVFVSALIVSVVVAGGLLLSTMGLRPDFAAALGTARFPFKFVVTIALAATAATVFWRALSPVSSERPGTVLLLLAPMLLLLGVAMELQALPSSAWAMAAQGKNALLCLTVVPALGAVPLGLMLWTLRQGATTRPTLAGFCAGLLAGGVAATFYAANCTDDSPLFVATWYPVAVLTLGVSGAALGRVLARW
jgi:hypothetical protein